MPNRNFSHPLLAPQIGDVLTPAEALRLAIQEAKKGVGFVSPNPLVGCTILDSQFRLLSVGFHRRVGEAHAEVDALAKLKSPADLQGAHMYVTLEPCAHAGRTPSCAKTIAASAHKPASVTFAVSDPNPIAEGGAAILNAAGISAKKFSDCETVDLGDRLEVTALAEDLAEIFLHGVQTSEPFVAVKAASSLDGCMAMSNGESKWITGGAAREHTHFLRAHYDAVLIGRNTFVADDPQLNVRHPNFPEFQNRVVLIDPSARTLEALPSSNLMKVRASAAVILVVKRGLAPEALANAPQGIRILEVETFTNTQGEEALEIPDLLKSLWAIGIRSIMIEGGARTYAAFFAQNRVQRLHLFEAPVIIGGQNAIAWSGGFGVERMSKKWKLANVERMVFGDDLYTAGRVISSDAR